jgi:hypothetical protein
MDASQVRKRGVSDALLIAPAYVQRVNACQVHKGGVSNANLTALAHVQGVNAG